MICMVHIIRMDLPAGILKTLTWMIKSLVSEDKKWKCPNQSNTMMINRYNPRKQRKSCNGWCRSLGVRNCCIVDNRDDIVEMEGDIISLLKKSGVSDIRYAKKMRARAMMWNRHDATKRRFMWTRQTWYAAENGAALSWRAYRAQAAYILPWNLSPLERERVIIAEELMIVLYGHGQYIEIFALMDIFSMPSTKKKLLFFFFFSR